MANLFLKMYLHLLKRKVDKLPPEEAFRSGRNFSHVLHEAQMVCYESAAKRGYIRAQYELADLLADFCDDWESYEIEVEALYWYEKAAAQGHTSAQYRAATYYFEGRGCTKDFAKAQYWYELCLPELKAKNRSDASTVERNLREIQVHGTTPPPRRQPTPPAPAPQPVPALPKSEPTLTPKPAPKAESAPISQPQSQFIVFPTKIATDMFIEAVHNYESNPDYSLQIFELLAEDGYVAAQVNCGKMYHNGIGCTKDREKALNWYMKAAKQGDAEAQYQCGKIFNAGIGRAQSYSLGLSYFEKAAQQGHKEAQFSYGCMHYMGQGCTKDMQKAKYWLRKAADQGEKQAQELLRKYF